MKEQSNWEKENANLELDNQEKRVFPLRENLVIKDGLAYNAPHSPSWQRDIYNILRLLPTTDIRNDVERALIKTIEHLLSSHRAQVREEIDKGVDLVIDDFRKTWESEKEGAIEEYKKGLEEKYKEIERLDVSEITYGAFRRAVLRILLQDSAQEK